MTTLNYVLKARYNGVDLVNLQRGQVLDICKNSKILEITTVTEHPNIPVTSCGYGAKIMDLGRFLIVFKESGRQYTVYDRLNSRPTHFWASGNNRLWASLEISKYEDSRLEQESEDGQPMGVASVVVPVLNVAPSTVLGSIIALVLWVVMCIAVVAALIAVKTELTTVKTELATVKTMVETLVRAKTNDGMVCADLALAK